MITIDPRSSKPIYEQIIDEIKESILKNILKPGDKLPSVRNLASMLLVNPNTVSKAYSELERQGVIETLKGRGTFISANFKVKMEEGKLMEIKENIKRSIVEACYIGLDKEKIRKIVDEIYKELEGEDYND